jgi:hypothetical protein
MTRQMQLHNRIPQFGDVISTTLRARLSWLRISP